MPIRRASSDAGIVSPAELKLLADVFEATSKRNESAVERENRAFFIISRYQAGVVDRDVLIALVNRTFT
jgi:hypothetical protein